MNTWWLLLMSRSRRDSATTGLGNSGYQSAGARVDVRISDFPALSVMSSYRSSAWAAVSSRMAKSSRSRTAGRVSSASRRSPVRAACPPARGGAGPPGFLKPAPAPGRGEAAGEGEGGAGERGEPPVPGPVGVPAGEVGRGPAGLHEPCLGAGADREVGEGLGDVALADPDGPVEDDGLPGGQPAEGGEVADLGGGQLRGGAEVEALEGGGGLEPCAADPPVQGHAVAAGDLVLAQDLEEVQVAEVPGVRLGEAGVERAQHAGQLQGPERGCEGAAVGDGHRAHACCSLSLTWVVTRAGCPARVPADAIQAQSPNTVRCGAGAPIAAASTPTAAALAAGAP